MERSLPAAVPKSLIVAGLLALFATLVSSSVAAAATLRLSWSSDSEADLSGYRLRYGTASGALDYEVDAGRAKSVDVIGLLRGVTYYFSVFAYDASGNESAPSAEVMARLTTDLSAPPIVESAMEMTSGSIYAVRLFAHLIMIKGQNFEPGATVDLGDGIVTAPPIRTATGDLVVRVTVPANAPPGPRSVTVFNPDLGVGSGTEMLTIVKSPDSNADCTVDIMDLNTLARAWNEETGEARYAPTVDLDGDDYVGPEDLTIFVSYFGREFSGCP